MARTRKESAELEAQVLDLLQNDNLTNLQLAAKLNIFVSVIENTTRKLRKHHLIKVVGKDRKYDTQSGTSKFQRSLVFGIDTADYKDVTVLKSGFKPIKHKPQTWLSLLGA